MNEKLDLTKILKDCPKGTKLYSPLFGEVTFVGIDEGHSYPIDIEYCFETKRFSFTEQGLYFKEEPNGECLLFPSKDQRDWSKFKVPVEKFDYSTLKPFDRVLVRGDFGGIWRVALFSCMLSNGMLCECRWDQGIPYNDETKHLVGTSDDPDKKYIWWEE